jgi:predicted ribosome quality control (RQC) complex YloA/Tae2 family protein
MLKFIDGGEKMLSLRELQRASRIAKERLLGSSLRRINQLDPYSLIFTFDVPAEKLHLLLSGSPEHARIALVEGSEPTASTNSFYQYLRAHLTGCHLKKMGVSDNDRQVSMLFQSREGVMQVILSILGMRSNIYLLDTEGKLLHALRPINETRKELKIGDPWINPRGSLLSEGVDRWEQVPDSQYFIEIDETYHKLEQLHDAEALARRIEQVIKKEGTFLDRKAINLQEDLGEARQAEINRRQGELLKNVLHTVKTGDDQIKAEDYETGEIIEIPLDPKLSPAANLESYFARYQKELRSEKFILLQLAELGEARQKLDVIGNQLKAALQTDPPDIQALESIAALPNIRRYLNRQVPKQKPAPPQAKATGKKEVPSRMMPKRYRTQDGLEIWVGRNDEGNDYLSTRLARGNDLFFHLEGYPGSHVVLRTEGRNDPSSRAILDACELAVHYSKMKNAGSADVHVAPIKNVKKPKGAKPGLVYVRSGKSIRLKRDPKRLQEILASRLDD